MGRTPTSPAAIERRDAVLAIGAIGATETKPLTRVRKIVRVMESHSEGFAAATASAMLGNGLRATVRRAMVAAQDGQCFTCGVALDRAPETVAVLFRLVPSIVGADETVAGVDAMAAGTLPGNVVAACATCNADRNRASDALGQPVCVTVKSMHDDTDGPVMLNASRIMTAWPKSPVKGVEPVPFRAIAASPVGPTRMDTRRKARLALLGW